MSRADFHGGPSSNRWIHTVWRTCSRTSFAWAMPGACYGVRGGRGGSEGPGRLWWAAVPAARADRTWIVDGSSHFNRPGPRLVDGLEILAHIVQPDLFPRPPDAVAARVS